MSPEALKRIGRYEILDQLGAGANGVVYRAQDPTIRRAVALKVLATDPDAGSSPSASQSRAALFEREAQAAGAIVHPNIVTLYDAGIDGSWYYLAMEFIEGETLAAELARRQRLPLERALEIGAAVAEALDYAHERGVVHRDIKPANLMILPDQTVKVADFGIARLAFATTTVTGDSIVGTPSYMSPEQVRGQKVDGRSDLFSLGVVLYELLTGVRPFRGDSLPAILQAIVQGSPPSAHEVEPSIPLEVSAIVSRAMAREPAERYARGKDLARDLRGRVATPATVTAILPAAERPKPRRIVPLAAAVGGLAAVGAVWALLSHPGSALAPVPAAKPGWLKVVSDPPGAEVSVDGKVVGRTPYTVEVPAGSHEIEFQKEGYYAAQQTARVVADERTDVELSMTARQGGR